jgi:hypothetical protein
MFLNDITDAMSIAEAKRQQAKRKQEAKNSVKNQSHTLEENTIAEFAPGPRRDDNDEVPKQILILANRWWNAGDKQPQITNVLRSLGWSIAQVESEDDAVQMMHNDGTTYFISADDFDPDVFEAVCPDCGMCQTHGNLNEIKKGQKDSNGFTKCWPGEHAEGTKKGKNGGPVRNCKPNESQGVAGEGYGMSGAQTAMYSKIQPGKKMNESVDTNNIKQQLAELNKKLEHAEYTLNQVRGITKGIKYESVALSIESQVSELAKELGIENEYKSEARDVWDAEKTLEGAVYNLEEPFTYYIYNIKNKVEELEDHIKYPDESREMEEDGGAGVESPLSSINNMDPYHNSLAEALNKELLKKKIK